MTFIADEACSGHYHGWACQRCLVSLSGHGAVLFLVDKLNEPATRWQLQEVSSTGRLDDSMAFQAGQALSADGLDKLRRVYLSQDGRLLVEMGTRTLRFRDVSSRKLLGELVLPDRIANVFPSPNGDFVAVLAETGHLQVFSAADQSVAGAPCLLGDARPTAFSADFTTMVVEYYDPKVITDGPTARFWDLKRGVSVGKPFADGSSFLLSPDGQYLASTEAMKGPVPAQARDRQAGDAHVFPEC